MRTKVVPQTKTTARSRMCASALGLRRLSNYFCAPDAA